MAPTRYKIGHRITSGGSRCPTCSSGREKTRGISASLGKSQLFDLERKVRKAPLKQKIDNFPLKSNSGFCTDRIPRLGNEAGAAAGLTSQDVSLVHEVGAEHSHTVGFPVPQQVPDDVAGAGIHPRRGLVQQQNLAAKPRGVSKPQPLPSAIPPQHTQKGLLEPASYSSKMGNIPD